MKDFRLSLFILLTIAMVCQAQDDLWGQNEGTIAGNTQYIIFGSSFKNIVGTNQ